jgi:hypothetical protein
VRVQFASNNICPILIALFSGSMLLWLMFGNLIRCIKEVDALQFLPLSVTH